MGEYILSMMDGEHVKTSTRYYLRYIQLMNTNIALTFNSGQTTLSDALLQASIPHRDNLPQNFFPFKKQILLYHIESKRPLARQHIVSLALPGR